MVEFLIIMELDIMEVKVMVLLLLLKNSIVGYFIFIFEIIVKNYIIVKEIKEKDKMGFIIIFVIILICVLIFVLCLFVMCCYRRK